MRDAAIAALAQKHWARWEAAIKIREPVALGALERLQAEINSGIISKHHDWETTAATREQHYAAGRKRAARLARREREMLTLIADGHTDQTAAAELGIGLETAKTYVRQACDKLGARNRTHAVTLAIQRGEID